MPIAKITPWGRQDVFLTGGQGLANGMWPSVSGAAAQTQVLDTVSNNLANVDTLGFKKDALTFKEYLSTAERPPEALDIPRGPIKDKDFYPLDGKDQSFVAVTGSYTNFKPGNLKVTQSPLDMAVDGPGFFEVSTPFGVRYTRQGSFKVATDGLLVTKEGYPVLSSQPAGLASAQLANAAVQPGQGRPPTQGGVAAGQGLPQPPSAETVSRYINLRDYGPGISVTDEGEVYGKVPGAEEGRLVAKLGIMEFRDTAKLRKGANQLFENPDPANFSAEIAKSQVKQGVLETSNVNPVEEMTSLIKANRMFEHDLKAMKTYGDMLGREANDIGKL
jgi:flagellar basal-body rod protein FlgF